MLYDTITTYTGAREFSNRGRDEQHPIVLTRKDLVKLPVNRFWVYDDESGTRWTKKDGKWMFLYQGNRSNVDDNIQYRGESPEFKAACVFTKRYFQTHPDEIPHGEERHGLGVKAGYDEEPSEMHSGGQFVLPASARELAAVGSFYNQGCASKTEIPRRAAPCRINLLAQRNSFICFRTFPAGLSTT